MSQLSICFDVFMKYSCSLFVLCVRIFFSKGGRERARDGARKSERACTRARKERV